MVVPAEMYEEILTRYYQKHKNNVFQEHVLMTLHHNTGYDVEKIKHDLKRLRDKINKEMAVVETSKKENRKDKVNGFDKFMNPPEVENYVPDISSFYSGENMNSSSEIHEYIKKEDIVNGYVRSKSHYDEEDEGFEKESDYRFTRKQLAEYYGYQYDEEYGYDQFLDDM